MTPFYWFLGTQGSSTVTAVGVRCLICECGPAQEQCHTRQFRSRLQVRLLTSIFLFCACLIENLLTFIREHVCKKVVAHLLSRELEILFVSWVYSCQCNMIGHRYTELLLDMAIDAPVPGTYGSNNLLINICYDNHFSHVQVEEGGAFCNTDRPWAKNFSTDSTDLVASASG